MKKGILIKSGESLEKLNDIKTIIFDKTGTLTIGKMALASAFLFEDNQKIKINSKNLYFQLAASIASKSTHPLSKALAGFYKGEKLDLEVKEIPGFGLSAIYKNKEVKLGKKEFIIDKNIEIGEEKSSPEIYMSYENKIAIFTFEDALKQDAKTVIDQLKKLDKKIILLSGDKEKVVETVAKRLGINEYYFGKTPIEKCDLLKNFKEEYQNIIMIGDGINDAPALVMADVSISPSSASDITKNAADIIFQGDKLSPVLEIILTAKKSQILIKQNFALALIYNLFAVPFAMMGYIVPVLAALAMSSSSIIVVVNALRVRKLSS